MPGMPRPPPMLRKLNLGLPGICFSRYGAMVRIQMSDAAGDGKRNDDFDRLPFIVGSCAERRAGKRQR